MLINFKDVNYDLKFSYNSFKYLEEFNIDDLSKLEKQPFRMLPITGMLLMGAINNDYKRPVPYTLVEEYLEQTMEEGNISETLEMLMKLLEESSFFKSLQKKAPKKRK